MITRWISGEPATSRSGQARARSRNRDHQTAPGRLWQGIRRWCQRRPCWGACCVLLASLLMLWEPVSLLQSDMLPVSTPWAGLLVAGLLCAMGLVDLLAPDHALVAGAIGIVLSLVSLVTVLGGFGIGMALGIIGSSYAIAWQPAKKTRSRPLFWSVCGCSMAIMFCMVTLVARGELAIAVPMAGPFTARIGRLECHNTRSTAIFSEVDHRTPVIVAYSDYCISSHIEIIRHVLGRTIIVTQANDEPSISRGVTTKSVILHNGVERDTNLTATNLDQSTAVSVQTNLVSQTLFQSADSVTVTDTTVSIS